MNLGNMRERITIKGQTIAVSGTGAQTTTDTTIASVWASVKPVRGNESDDAGRLASIQTYLVTIHYRADIDTANFITWGAKELQVRAVTDRWEQNNGTPTQFLTLECEYGRQI